MMVIIDIHVVFTNCSSLASSFYIQIWPPDKYLPVHHLIGSNESGSLHPGRKDSMFIIDFWFLDLPWHHVLLYDGIGGLDVLGASVTLEFSSETLH